MTRNKPGRPMAASSINWPFLMSVMCVFLGVAGCDSDDAAEPVEKRAMALSADDEAKAIQSRIDNAQVYKEFPFANPPARR